MSEERDFRFVVCIDVSGTSLKDAYGRLRQKLATGKGSFGWETSDEWYEHDMDDGMPGDPDELQKAICQWIDENPEEERDGQEEKEEEGS